MNIKTVVIIVNCIFLTIGICGSPLVIRLYFVNGGKRIWFASFLQSSGFPIILFPLLLSFLRRRRQRRPRREEEEEEKEKSQFFLMKPPLFIAAIAVGLLTGFDNYLYSYGIAYIPVSTAALITSAQLGFTALFAFLMVKQKFTPFTINSIVLLTIGSAVLAIDSNSDKPANETHKKYVIGFLMTLGAAIIYGFILPLMELGYKKSRQQVTYTLVLEFQLVLCFVATCFCLVGMLVSGDFKVIASEAREFKLGESVYYVVVVSTAVIAQAFFVGAIGLIFNVSSLVSGIMISALLPVTLILAVIFFHDKFQAAKGVSLALCLWGSVSYFYGQFKSEEKTKAQAQDEETHLSQLPVTDSLA